MLCYVYNIQQNSSHQLTRSGNTTQLQWINNNSLALIRSDEGEKPQVWLFENLVGEGQQITDHETGVQSFKPFANGLLFLADNPELKKRKKRKDEFGSFTHFEQEESASALYYTNIVKMKEYKAQLKSYTEEDAKKKGKPVVEISKILEKSLKILNLTCSPLNDAIYLNCRSKDYLVYNEEKSWYRLKLNPERVLEEYLQRARENGEDSPQSIEGISYLGKLTRILLPKGASITCVSPDGNKLLINYKERDNKMYTQSDLWIVNLKQVEKILENEDISTYLKKISQNLDQQITGHMWVDSGIFVSYIDGTKTRIAKVSETGAIEILDLQNVNPMGNFHVSESGFLIFIGVNENSFYEIYVSTHPLTSSNWMLKKLTSFGKKIENWDLGSIETIKWKSKDGTEIEGVLRKPLSFNKNKKYPLVFVVHGGPDWFSGEFLLDHIDLCETGYYPTVQFVHKDILVLKPNYRGSLGRGQEFLELNKDNLGVGDLWDIETAIEYLDSKGFIDKTKIGCMGWSQGGYISAFVGIHSDKFSAVSVGAGVSDWYTYHIGNDIPLFTTHYLSGSPFRDRSLYMKTAPISQIQKARTPMLIQHGGKDHRVPLVNATELYRGLKEMNVPVELFVYPEMAHLISKPKENRAAMYQNLTWFNYYLLDEKLDFRLACARAQN